MARIMFTASVFQLIWSGLPAYASARKAINAGGGHATPPAPACSLIRGKSPSPPSGISAGGDRTG